MSLHATFAGESSARTGTRGPSDTPENDGRRTAGETAGSGGNPGAVSPRGSVARARVWALPYYVALGLASEAIGLPAPLALVVRLRHVLVLAFVGWLDTRLPVLGVAYPWLGRIEAWAGGRVSTAIVRASRAA